MQDPGRRQHDEAFLDEGYLTRREGTVLLMQQSLLLSRGFKYSKRVGNRENSVLETDPEKDTVAPKPRILAKSCSYTILTGIFSIVCLVTQE